MLALSECLWCDNAWGKVRDTIDETVRKVPELVNRADETMHDFADKAATIAESEEMQAAKSDFQVKWQQACNWTSNSAGQAEYAVEQVWSRVAKNEQVKAAVDVTKTALEKTCQAVDGPAVNCNEEIAATTRSLYRQWSNGMPQLNGSSYTISPKCLLAMSVAVAAPGASRLAGLGLRFLGFSAAGVVQGSLAAAWQSSMGKVAGESLFATLQSIAAKGAFSTAADLPLVVLTGKAAQAAFNFCGFVEQFLY